MHVAMLIGALGKGGSERVMVNLADFLIRSGHQVTMVTQYKLEVEYPLNPGAKRIISDITPAETTGSRIINFKRRFMKLRKIWKSEKPDVILSFIGKNNIMAVLTSRFLPVKVVVSMRGEPEMEYYNRWMKTAARYLFRFADGVVLQTKNSRDFFPAAVNRRVAVLKNLVNPIFFRPRYQGPRERLIIAVGRIDSNKNHRMLIDAFQQIAGEFPEHQVCIYGDGVLRQTLQEEVARRGLADRFLLPGISDDMVGVLESAEVYVLTSDTEGVPNALIESMLMGLPVIATDCPCGGPGELIDHGRNGLLYPVRDTARLVESLRYVLGNRPAAEAMGIEAARLQADYHADAIGRQWQEYLLSIVKNGINTGGGSRG